MSSINQEKSIIQIIDMIDKNLLLLPEFQRAFKWPIDKAETLFDSLIQDLFIGSIIISKPAFDLACKEIDKRPRGSTRHKPKAKDYSSKQFEDLNIFALLDGQQRVTSIYRVLKGIDTLYLVINKLDLLISKGIWNEDSLEVNSMDIYELIHDIDSKDIDGYVCLPIHEIFEHNLRNSRDDKIRRDLLVPIFDNKNIPSEDRAAYSEISLHLIQLFAEGVSKKESLLSVQLLDLDIEKFCLYFERSNSQGITLTFKDIVTAKIYTKFKLGTKEKEAAEKYANYFNENLVDGIIRYINFMAYDEVTKSSILSNINGDDFKTHWESVVEDLVAVQMWLLRQHWLFTIESLVYKIMLFPILAFYQNLKSKDFSSASTEQLNLLKLWFFGSLITHRYGGGAHGSTNVVLKNDLATFRNLARGLPMKPMFWDTFLIDTRKENFIRLDHDKSAESIGWSYLCFNQRVIKNFENDARVNFDQSVDVHHIFPRSFIKDNYGERSDEFDVVDSFLNKTRINKIPNIKIGKKAPSIYLTEIQKINSKIEESLNTHFIDDIQGLIKGDYDSDFLEFMDLRYNEIKPLVKGLEQNFNHAKSGDYNLISFDF